MLFGSLVLLIRLKGSHGGKMAFGGGGVPSRCTTRRHCFLSQLPLPSTWRFHLHTPLCIQFHVLMKVPFVHRLPLSSAWRHRRLFSSQVLPPFYIMVSLYKKVPSAIFLVQQAFFPHLLWEGDLPRPALTSGTAGALPSPPFGEHRGCRCESKRMKASKHAPGIWVCAWIEGLRR